MDAAVHLVLRDSDPNGIVVATRDNWTGKAIALPIADLLAKKVPMTSAGVYVLTGVLDDGSERPVAYVGEAEEVQNRLTASHQQFKKLHVTWQRAVIFVSNSRELNKAHVQWLEAHLIALAKKANRVHLENGNAKAAPRLSEPDEVFVTSFLANMLVLYPLLRVNAFDVPYTVSPEPHASGGAGTTVYFHKGKGASRTLVATGRTTPEGGIVLLAGSLIAKQAADHLQEGNIRHRQHLADSDALEDYDASWWRLTKDYALGSPSAAASVANGGALNGLEHWRDDKGTTLGSLLAAATE